MILRPKDSTWELPIINDANDIFKYIADFNGINYFETDLNGVIVNELGSDLFLIDRLDLISPNKDYFKYDGVLFFGLASDFGNDVDKFQFDNIIKKLTSRGFIKQFELYIKCDYQFNINNIRPIYNSVKYTKTTNCTGIEINYSIWI